VDKADTTTSVSSSANPSVFGNSVTFTASVSPSAATGTVQFTIDGSNSGSAVALSGGSATSSAISSLSVGNHVVTAVYSGDSNYNGNTGTLAGGQTVVYQTTTGLVSSVNPSNSGSPVTFTATVTASPTNPNCGTIDFKDATSTLHTETLTISNTGQYQTPSLSVGTHTMTAAYTPAPGGSCNYASSTSSVVNQVVNLPEFGKLGAVVPIFAIGILYMSLRKRYL
jgi:hypothetical protein